MDLDKEKKSTGENIHECKILSSPNLDDNLFKIITVIKSSPCMGK